MNSKILSFASLSLLAVMRFIPQAAAVEPDAPVPAAVVAADREFLNTLENGTAVTPAPAQPARVAPARPVAATKKQSREVKREEKPKKTVTAKSKAPKTKRTTTALKTEEVEVRRAIPVEHPTVAAAVGTRGDRDDDEEEGWEESGDRDSGFLSRLFSR